MNLLHAYFPVAWIGHFGIGLTYGFMGPAQPYLSRQVGVDHQTISTIYSVRAASTVVSSLVVGYLFDTAIFRSADGKGSQRKLILLSICHTMIAVSLLSIPFITSFPLLLLAIMLLCIGTGGFDCGSNSMINFMLGPKTSRPFTQSLHAFVSLGFAVVSFGFPYILPTYDQSREEICHHMQYGSSLNIKIDNTSFSGIDEGIEEFGGFVKSDSRTRDIEWPSLFWPCFAIACCHIVDAIGYIFQVLFNFRLPEYVPEKHIQPEITSMTRKSDVKIENINTPDNQGNSTICSLLEKDSSSSEEIYLESETEREITTFPATSLLSPTITKLPVDNPNRDMYYVPKELGEVEQKEKMFDDHKLIIDDEKILSGNITHRNNHTGCTKPWWPVFLGTVFYFFSCGVDGFFQSQTYSFALCGPLKLEPTDASYINFSFFGSYCIGRLISIPLSRKVCPTTILCFSLISCCLSSAFLSFFGGMSLEALLVGTALMGFSICFQFASCLTWLASRIPNGMKSAHTSLMFTGANFGWFILPPLASALFYHISPKAPFVTAFICNVLHLGLFILMHKSTRLAIL